MIIDLSQKPESQNIDNSGYLHPLYAQSLAEFGKPLELPTSGGWLLERPIAGTSFMDGMGCYPLFACRDWSGIEQDLDRVASQLVSVSLVTDPFGNYAQEELLKSFPDLATPYKEHFVIDLRREAATFVATHHQRNAYKALKNIQVELIKTPLSFLEEWMSLYDHLIARHHIQGISKFSHHAFSIQLTVPGIVAFRAIRNQKTVGMLLWYVRGNTGYYHLGAHSPDGYEVNASFALFWRAIEFFSTCGLHWLSLGAGAGAQGDSDDGLTRFKRGWSSSTRTAFLCGRIFDRKKYDQILSLRGLSDTRYFPAYRAGEFA